MTKQKINQGHYIEVSDRIFVIQQNLQDFVYNHPATTKKDKKKIDKIQGLLWDLYQKQTKKSFKNK